MLEISPLEFRFEINSGKIFQNSFTIKNTGEKPISVKLSSEPAKTTNPTYSHLAEWVTLSAEKVNLESNETKEISFSVNIPEVLPAGGQYANIIATINPDDTSQGIEIYSRIGIRLYASSNIDIDKNVSISPPQTSSFVLSGPIFATSVVENHGNIDFNAKSDFIVSSLLGKELYSNTVITSVLPSNTKEFYQEWHNKPFFGIYQMSYTIDALDTHLSLNRLIFAFSSASLCILILIVSALIGTIVYRYKKLHR